MRQVGFTLLSWELREKDYSRKANGAFSGVPAGVMYLVVASKKNKVETKATFYEVVKGSRRYREGSMG